jgi:hypothetical protein
MWVKNSLIFVEDINVRKAVHGNGVADKSFKEKFIMCFGCLAMNKQSCEYGTNGVLNMLCCYMLEDLTLGYLICLKKMPEFKSVMTLLCSGVLVPKLK